MRIIETHGQVLLTPTFYKWRITNPVPLKHSTETAFVIVLSFVILLSGFFTSLLPRLPQGIFYWCVLFGLAVLYPLVLLPFFKANRVDYEFRFLHWFPAGLVLLWLILEILSRHSTIALILFLGFTYLWSLPLVIFGFVLLIMFVLHVIRRRQLRMPVLIALLALFTVGSIVAEAQGFNPVIARTLYPENSVTRWAQNRYNRVAALVSSTGGSPDTATGSIDVIATTTSSKPTSALSKSSSQPAVIIGAHSSSKPSTLPSSGPEHVAAVALVLMAMYTGVLHRRAKERA